MSKLTRSAELRTCTVRLPDCGAKGCVFAHAPSWASGTALKSPDWWGAYACASCHDILDGRKPSRLTRTEKKAVWFRAIFETQAIMFDEGLLIIG